MNKEEKKVCEFPVFITKEFTLMGFKGILH